MLGSLTYWLSCVLLAVIDLRCVCCLFVSDINVPQIVDFRDNVTLSCSYDMSGHTLNSVKWYKNGMEFFRYSPLMHPVYMKFPVNGIHLIEDKSFCNESSCRVQLCLMNIKSSGLYRCEVSGDAPYFKLTARAANMTVAALPQKNPLISSFNSMYRLDDFVQANCTTDYTSLAATLTWYINGIKASYSDLQPSIETTIPAHEYILRRKTLQLNFYANDPRFNDVGHGGGSSSVDAGIGINGISIVSVNVATHRQRSLELRCMAEIENFPDLKRETTLNAVLLHDEDFKNQKLVNSGVAPFSLHSSLFLLCAILFLRLLTFTNDTTITHCTFQYDGDCHKKKTRMQIYALQITTTTTTTQPALAATPQSR